MSKQGKQGKRQLILIVDDDQDMRIFLSNLLKSEGFDPVAAKDGTEGLKKAMKQPPEIILLDVPMPGKDSFRMFHHLKRHESLACIPVIMMSALDHNMFRQYKKQHQPLQANGTYEPDAYLRKPLESEELFSLINSILDRPGRVRQ